MAGWSFCGEVGENLQSGTEKVADWRLGDVTMKPRKRLCWGLAWLEPLKI